MNHDKFENHFWTAFGVIVFANIAFWTAVLVIAVLVLKHFGIV